MKFKKFVVSLLVLCILFSSIPYSVAAYPSLKEGSYADWVDRIDEMPSYATDLYDWFSENSKEGGALRTGVTDTLLPDTNNEYAHLVTKIVKNNISFNYDESDTTDDKFAILKAATKDEIKSAKDETIEYVEAIYAAFDRDNPEVFWLNGSYSCISYTSYSFSDYTTQLKGVGKYEVNVYLLINTPDFDIRHPNYRSADLINKECENLEKSINTILSGDYPANGSYLDKVKYFNNYLTVNNEFNTSTNLDKIDSSYCRTCLGALYGSVGSNGPVCSGYSKAFNVLCDRVGIPCVLVDGQANSGGTISGHMWNYVQMENGNWYAIDVTWNDPMVNGITGAETGYESEIYFLVGNKTMIDGLSFIESHPPTNSFFVDGLCFTNGPVLSDFTYVEDSAQEEFGKIKSASLLLGQELTLIFKVQVSEAYKNPYLKVTREGETIILSSFTMNDSFLEFNYYFSNPSLIGDSLRVELYCGDELLDVIENYSVVSYCERMSNKEISNEFKLLLADVLEYGASYQLYRNYKVDNLMNSKVNLIPSVFDQVTSTDTEISKSYSENDYFKSATLVCNDKIDFIFKFVTDDIDTINISINNKFYGKKDFYCEDKINNIYSIRSDALSATQLNDICFVELYDNNKHIQSLKYSVKSYVYKFQNQKDDNNELTALANVVRSLYNYGKSSKAYWLSVE